jgi:hypothetical protein
MKEREIMDAPSEARMDQHLIQQPTSDGGFW